MALYSSFERYWSAFKSGVEAAFRERKDKLLEHALPDGESMTSRRSRILRGSNGTVNYICSYAAIYNLHAYFNFVQIIIAQSDDVLIGHVKCEGV